MTFEEWLVVEYSSDINLAGLLSVISIDTLYRIYEGSLKK